MRSRVQKRGGRGKDVELRTSIKGEDQCYSISAMSRVFILGLIVFLFASTAQAGLLDRDMRESAFLDDLLHARQNRYVQNPLYSYFAGPRKKRLAPLASRDLLGQIISHAETYRYTVQPNDTLKKIAREHQTTLEVIKQINKIKSSRIKPGQKFWIPYAPLVIEINKTRNRLYVKTGGVLLKDYPVSTGKSEAQTPLGVFFIRSRYPFPTWFHKGVVVSSSSPDNFLGTRWLGFDEPKYGIHGTIFPEQIGQSVSKGCVRMKNEDVEELYEVVPVGTAVIISGN
jgi:L,D-transpeptidase ErfK/SrfK